MNPLIALLTPQAGPIGIPPVSAGVAIQNNAATSLATIPGNAGVQVDSSSFLNILAATNAQSAKTSEDLSEAIDDPFAQLATLLAKQKTPTPTAAIIKDNLANETSSIDAKSILNLQTVSANEQAAVQALTQPTAKLPEATGKELPSPSGLDSEITTQSQSSSTRASEATNPNNIGSSKLNPNIVRPAEANNITNLLGQNAEVAAALTANTQTQKSFLTNSAKLLKRFEQETGELQPPTADGEVIDAKSSLSQATKAYSILGNQDKDEAAFFNNRFKLPSAEEAKQLILSSSAANNNESSLNNNNVTSIDSFRNHTAQVNYLNLSKAQGAYHTPAEQASVKIANAINDGIRHINIELHPAKLGHLEVKMELSHEGPSKLIVYVEKHETMALLQKDSGILERVLHDAGFKTDSGSLSFNLRGDSHPGLQEQSAGANGGRGHGSNGGNDNEIAKNDNPLTGIEYRLDLSNGVVDITV